MKKDFRVEDERLEKAAVDLIDFFQLLVQKVMQENSGIVAVAERKAVSAFLPFLIEYLKALEHRAQAPEEIEEAFLAIRLEFLRDTTNIMDGLGTPFHTLHTAFMDTYQHSAEGSTDTKRSPISFSPYIRFLMDVEETIAQEVLIATFTQKERIQSAIDWNAVRERLRALQKGDPLNIVLYYGIPRGLMVFVEEARYKMVYSPHAQRLQFTVLGLRQSSLSEEEAMFHAMLLKEMFVAQQAIIGCDREEIVTENPQLYEALQKCFEVQPRYVPVAVARKVSFAEPSASSSSTSVGIFSECSSVYQEENTWEKIKKELQQQYAVEEREELEATFECIGESTSVTGIRATITALASYTSYSYEMTEALEGQAIELRAMPVGDKTEEQLYRQAEILIEGFIAQGKHTQCTDLSINPLNERLAPIVYAYAEAIYRADKRLVAEYSEHVCAITKVVDGHGKLSSKKLSQALEKQVLDFTHRYVEKKKSDMLLQTKAPRLRV